MRLLGKFEIDHSWGWKAYVLYGIPGDDTVLDHFASFRPSVRLMYSGSIHCMTNIACVVDLAHFVRAGARLNVKSF